MKHKFLTILLCVSVILMSITGSIGLPIYVRSFYYCQIDGYGLPEATGYDKETIKEAYDQVLDYLTLPGRNFGTGVFPFSEEGEAHFRDCKKLFDLNGAVLLASAVMILLLYILSRRGKFTPGRPFGGHFTLTCGVGMVGLFGLIGGLAALDFDRAFVVFHQLFFPGKENWLFNPQKDGIIQILPQDFFMSCGILIVGSIVLLSLGMILYGILEKNRKSKTVPV